MKNNKTLGFILLVVGLALSIITLLFIPVPAFGLYLLLTAYKPQMGKVARIIIAVVGAFVIVMTIALLLTV